MSLAFAVLLLAGFSPQASTPQETSAPATTPAKEEQKICKTEGFSGSRIKAKRVCRTEAEWRGEADRTGKQMERRD